jgi:hypothetical protein
MKPVTILLLAALPTIGACAPNNPPAAIASHPPTADLVCPDEPEVEAALASDPSGVAFDAAVRKAGQDCRDALARVCRWHKERGAVVTCPEGVKP